MRRKGKKPFGRVLTDAAGIPPELVSSLPLLSMTGQEELFIENFKGILQYTDAVLLLQTKACLLRIEGQHLFLVYSREKNYCLAYLFAGLERSELCNRIVGV